MRYGIVRRRLDLQTSIFRFFTTALELFWGVIERYQKATPTPLNIFSNFFLVYSQRKPKINLKINKTWAGGFCRPYLNLGALLKKIWISLAMSIYTQSLYPIAEFGSTFRILRKWDYEFKTKKNIFFVLLSLQITKPVSTTNPIFDIVITAPKLIWYECNITWCF
jgi:hypothetical protein